MLHGVKMSKNNAPQKHHYVPQFLLRRFSSPYSEGGKSKIFWYDKQKCLCRYTAIKDIAFKDAFYTYVDNEETINLEKDLFSKLDYEASIVLREICKTKSVPQEDIKKHWLLYFLAAQFLRIPRKRENLIRIAEDIKKQLGPEFPLGLLNRPVGLIDTENIKKWSLTDFEKKCEYQESELRHKKLMLIDNKSDVPFIISDNPVCIIRPDEAYDINSIPGDIVLPLTPHLALCAYSAEHEPQINAIRKNIVLWNNIYQIHEAERFVFSNDEKLLNEMSKYDTYEHPRLCFEGQALEMLKNLNLNKY